MYKKTFKEDFLKTYPKIVSKLTALKLVSVTPTRLKVTQKGLFVLDNVLQEFVL